MRGRGLAWLAALAACVAACACASRKSEDAPPVSEPTVHAGAAAGAGPAATGGEGATMSTLDQAAAMRFEDYDPARVIAAVNALQPLGKERALEALRAAVARGKPQDSLGLFWVLRVLFDPPAGEAFPRLLLGQPDVSPPPTAAALPRFPIVLVDDVPLLVVRGYMLGGLPETIDDQLTYFATSGTLRTAPLSPPAAVDPVEVTFRRAWTSAYGGGAVDVTEHVRAQLARMSSR